MVSVNTGGANPLFGSQPSNNILKRLPTSPDPFLSLVRPTAPRYTLRITHALLFVQVDVEWETHRSSSLKICLRNVPVPTKWDNRRKFRVSYRMRPAIIAG